VGLSGEIRSVNQLEMRISEVQRLGFQKCLIPAHSARQMKGQYTLELLPVRNIGEALRLVFNSGK
jgi:DNA repair protein RadA/Sms